MKVVCLNIWIGGVLLDEIVDFLEHENADIVLLQEVFDGHDKQLKPQYRSLSILQASLQYSHVSFAPAFIEDVDGQKILQGQAILSKFPLHGVSTVFYGVPFGERINERTFFSKSPRNLQHVTANVGGKTLHLFNTQGIWGEDGYDNPDRLEMSKIILKEVSGCKPVILAGDFNVLPNTQTIAPIEEKLRSVFKDELITSFNVKRKDLQRDPGYAHSVVDMFFVSDDITVTSHACPQVDISDHFPFVVTLELS